MKQLALRATILGGFGLALAILLILSIVTYRSIHLTLDDSRWVAHTQEVMATTEASLSLLKDAETGQRLPLTLDAAAIAAYRRNVTTWQQRIAETCARRGATYAQVLTSWPLERTVVPYLRARRILQ